ncbi:ParB/RepB/Spo0J family partition protein [Phenylobacterium soli]|uniref:Chromosome partitioning protein ParB n=1 Tax=Phenylobacterium soli TaxID=2170551 RepID=A0A328ALN0_9CAUL|nr:ParB/RepB/Spo0J family partition protein [Phenylobacterium soli]RAK54916.1 chromosome partitioning protein ParB [Phenylobacterium soli]
MTSETVTPSGAMIEVPLNKLKTSPRNARKTPHSEAAIEALAASIAAKGLLQAPVVEPELDAAGAPTGCYLVTIGEGRRRALRLRAQRKEIRKTEPVRCVVDTAHDPHEISLDENVTRSDMHPADQFEAFRELAERRGFGPEEIAARFGVSAHVVRQRLRLAAVSPKLMAIYREDGLTLDQLMAFAVSEDHERQEQVYDQLSWNRSAPVIRRAMTESKAPAHDRRAVFVGAEAYAEAGGTLLRDLFTEDGGGWFEDVALLDRLGLEKLEALAVEVRTREGWRWSSAALDYPHGHGCRRVYPRAIERSEAEQAQIAALSAEFDALVSQWESADDLPGEVDARLKYLDAALQAFGEPVAYDPEELARGGVFVVLGHDGAARIERGFIRPQDEPPAPGPEAAGEGEDAGAAGAGEGALDRPEDSAEDETAPLSERLVLELTAYRTLGLREALGSDPTLALTALVHALALRTFYPPYDQPTCLDAKLVSAYLDGHAPGAGESAAGQRIAERHAAWAARLPREAGEAWTFVRALDGGALLDLLAHCVSLGVNAVRNPLDRRPGAWSHADALAEAAGLDMRLTWTATAETYFGRVTKARILEAVREGAGDAAAERLAGLTKREMAQAAEQALAGTGWLPPLLRTALPAAEIAASLAAE